MPGIGFDPSVTKVTLDSPSFTKAPTSSGPAFGNALKAALDGVNHTQKNAEALAQAYQMEDPNVGVEETMIAMSKANISFQALVQVRNKLVSAYHDIMNMQV
ncbi:MAG TPA: flagellar hook-basal body complex protein FliE [Burkholderiales bacterium]|nr:flagellar hook-basal body complex protein FliE [Burkholderiales bacterium]